jgi:hypothetical protein
MASLGSKLQNYQVPSLPQLPGGDPIFWRQQLQNLSKSINLLVKQFQALDQGAWTAYTPTLSAFTGTLTSATIGGKYVQIDKTVHWAALISIPTNGTAGTYLLVGLPLPYANTVTAPGAYGKEYAVIGKGIAGVGLGGSNNTVGITFSDGTYPGGNGYVIVVQGTYETP